MQTIFHEKFVVDANGKRTAVLIDAKEYIKILRLLEEVQALKIMCEGEKEYKQGKLKAIHSLSDLDK